MDDNVQCEKHYWYSRGLCFHFLSRGIALLHRESSMGFKRKKWPSLGSRTISSFQGWGQFIANTLNKWENTLIFAPKTNRTYTFVMFRSLLFWSRFLFDFFSWVKLKILSNLGEEVSLIQKLHVLIFKYYIKILQKKSNKGRMQKLLTIKFISQISDLFDHKWRKNSHIWAE